MGKMLFLVVEIHMKHANRGGGGDMKCLEKIVYGWMISVRCDRNCYSKVKEYSHECHVIRIEFIERSFHRYILREAHWELVEPFKKKKILNFTDFYLNFTKFRSIFSTLFIRKNHINVAFAQSPSQHPAIWNRTCMCTVAHGHTNVTSALEAFPSTPISKTIYSYIPVSRCIQHLSSCS